MKVAPTGCEAGIEMKTWMAIPREHGAWAMLYAPFLAGWFVTGGVGIPLFLFFVGATFFFFLHEPLFTLFRVHPGQPGSREKYERARRYFVLYLAIALGAIIPLVVYYDRILLLFAGIGAVIFLALQTYLMASKSEKTIFAELLVVVGLTSTAPLVRYILLEQFDELAMILWGLNIAFFTSSIFYVKMRVERFARKEHATARTAHCLLYHAFLVFLLGMFFWYGKLSWLVILAFFPILFRALHTARIQEQRLNLMKIGLAEIGYACVFVILLSMGLQNFG